MKKIPSGFLIKPELTSRNRNSKAFKSSIKEIIDWAVEIEFVFYGNQFEKDLEKYADNDYFEFISYQPYEQKHSNDPQLKSILDQCQKFKKSLTINDLLTFLDLKPKRNRGRPPGKSEESSNLDIGVEWYRNLREIITTEYNIEAKTELLSFIATELKLDKEKLTKHLKRPQSRVNLNKRSS